jgi:hypothetical protein
VRFSALRLFGGRQLRFSTRQTMLVLCRQMHLFSPASCSRRHVINTKRRRRKKYVRRGLFCVLFRLEFSLPPLLFVLAELFFCMEAHSKDARLRALIHSLLRRNRDSNSPLAEQPQWRLYLFFKRTLLANNETTLQFLHSH